MSGGVALASEVWVEGCWRGPLAVVAFFVASLSPVMLANTTPPMLIVGFCFPVEDRARKNG